MEQTEMAGQPCITTRGLQSWATTARPIQNALTFTTLKAARRAHLPVTRKQLNSVTSQLSTTWA